MITKLNKNKCIQDIFSKYDTKKRFRNKFHIVITTAIFKDILKRKIGEQVALESLPDYKIIELCRFMNVNITMSKD